MRWWLCWPDNICFYCYEQKDVNKYAGGRETEISPHRHHIRQTSRRNRSTESYSVSQLTYWAFIICHLIYQRNQYIFQSPRQCETVTLHRYMITGTSAVYWLVGQWDTHWDICWAAQQNILSLIKVDNKLTQLQLLVIWRSMSGWGWYTGTELQMVQDIIFSLWFCFISGNKRVISFITSQGIVEHRISGDFYPSTHLVSLTMQCIQLCVY